MLSKLMKYDLKKMTKVLIYIYIISLGLALITRFINIWKNIQFFMILGSVFASLTYSAIVSILVNMFIAIIGVFIRSFYKDESYLTHTLPVTKNNLLASKYLSALIVIFISVLVSFLDLFIVLYSPEFMQQLKMILELSFTSFNIPVSLALVLIGLIILFEITTMISITFASIVMACRSNNSRVIKGVKIFIKFYLITGIFTVLVASIIAGFMGQINNMFAETMSQEVFIMLLIVALVMYILYSVMFYFVARKQFNKGVNVD